jgi:hypothetical protein
LQYKKYYGSIIIIVTMDLLKDLNISINMKLTFSWKYKKIKYNNRLRSYNWGKYKQILFNYEKNTIFVRKTM